MNDGSAFSRMVQSTGSANAQYLRSLVQGTGKENKSSSKESQQLDGQKRRLASSRWAAAAQFALAASQPSAWDDLQRSNFEDMNNILMQTKDAVITLEGVLAGRHDSNIDDTLNMYQVSSDRWWSSLYKVIEGTLPQHALFVLILSFYLQ